MSNVHKDHTMEFPMPVDPKKPNLLVRIIKSIRGGFIYNGESHR